MKKVLVVYFSATGVTAKFAKELSKLEKADLYEIKPKTPYTTEDLDFKNKNSRSNLEMGDMSCRPEIEGKIEKMEQYDTVFIGFPIWWGREPSIIDTFLESYDFSNKKIIPFCTSSVSDVKQAINHIKTIVGDKINVENGKRLGMDGTVEEVKIWTELLSL